MTKFWSWKVCPDANGSRENGIRRKEKGLEVSLQPFCIHCLNALSAWDICQINLEAWAH
jgi:hypothetical protein